MKRAFLVLLFAAAIQAANIPVTSPPTIAHVQTAYDSASNGDTIVFPLNDSATWAAPFVVSKAVTFNGNGTTLTVSGPLTMGLFEIKNITNATDVLRFTGFTINLVDFSGSGHAIASGEGPDAGTVAVEKLRIDHNTIFSGQLQMELGGCHGVVDHNYFYNSLATIETTAGSPAQADASWADLSAGTTNAMFIEDNHFIDNGSYPSSSNVQPKIDGYNGGKVVIRNNVFDFTGVPYAPANTSVPIGLHGSAAGGVPLGYWQLGSGARRAHSVIEVYSNTMTGARIDFMYGARGSANLVWGNSLVATSNGTGNERIILQEEEQIDGPTEGWQWDPVRTAWPAEDQVFNSFFWNNTFDGFQQTSNNVAVINNSDTFIQLNRDYFLHAPQASGGSESFTGANGAAGSFPTDGGTHNDHLGNPHTYPTLGTMTFTASGPNAYYPYTPAPYPHPLVTALDGGGTSSARGFRAWRRTKF